MGFFKQVASALKPSRIAGGPDAARTPPASDTPEANLDALTPEERLAYEANAAAVAESRAEAQAAWDRAQAEREDGEDRDDERVVAAAAELAARDEARIPYRADDPPTVAISRLATRGETQLAELLDHLQESGLAARPDRVFGVYRVPDRISEAVTPHSERGRVVEWDVVHEPLEAGTAASADRPVATSFVGTEQWVARRPGEPAVLDEELAARFCGEAGIGPDRCLGLARISEFRAVESGIDEAVAIRTLVRGVVAIHPPESSGAFARMQAAAPLELPPASPEIHHEVLNWAALAPSVHPDGHQPPPVPSPFPYLPATPQELLRAYLEVVGVAAADCYGVQATVDQPRVLQPGATTTDDDARQACADGKPRTRSHGCEHVVISYRDRPEYVEGRRRWDVYQERVLVADLRKGTGVHRPLRAEVEATDGVPAKTLRAAVRVAETVDRFDTWGDETVPPYRYCWPLEDAASEV